MELAAWHIDHESWLGLRRDANDAKGANYWGGLAMCNYVANPQQPFELP